MTKPHFDNILFQLSDEQQSQICDWLESIGYTRTLQKLAEPEPAGFGLRTHRSALHRFYRRYTASHRSDNLIDAQELHNEDPSHLTPATQNSLRHLAFQLSTSAEGAEHFGSVSQWLSKQQYLELAREQLALSRARFAFDREKWEFDIARQVLLHRAALDQIAGDQSTTDEEKINRARTALFGPLPT